MGEGVTQLCMDRKLYQRELSKSERAKQDRFLAAASATLAPVQSPSTSISDTTEKDSIKGDSGPNNGSHVKTTSSNGELDRSAYIDTILEHLTPDDVRVLIRSEDELAQATHFSRIFPTQVLHFNMLNKGLRPSGAQTIIRPTYRISSRCFPNSSYFIFHNRIRTNTLSISKPRAITICYLTRGKLSTVAIIARQPLIDLRGCALKKST